MFDLEAYLGRIGLAGAPSISELHRAHVTSIPFENLDPQRGVTVELDLPSLQRKLVNERRGGYCFEHNTLFQAALEALGARVEPMLARVRWGNPPEHVNPLTHMVLRVTTEDAVWLADVGFGAGALLEPIPFGPGGPYEQSGWRFQVVEEDDELVLQADSSGGWRDVYTFLPRTVKAIDIELGNWWVCARPDSVFVTGLIASAARSDGTRISLSDWNGHGLELVTRTPAGSTATPVTREQIPGLLVEYFELGGFAIGRDGRVVHT